jgi:AAA+ superfamily predicted ATPase
MNIKPELHDLFGPTTMFPDIDARERLANLVGLDDQKSRLTKILGLLVNPASLTAWANKFHPGATELLDTVLRRPPLVVLAGDVGSGKTELAETIGDAVARQQKIGVLLLPLSLTARGEGRVGEMTQLITGAFETAASQAESFRSSGKANGGVILLVDEADALAQSRESSQMHHEDRAGVNAFIRGIDRLAAAKLPAAVIMCTNRLSALDPAIRRRAADVLPFARPDHAQRAHVLSKRLGALGFMDADIEALVEITGPDSDDGVGFTFSDLTQRLIPSIVLDAFPEQAVSVSKAIAIAKRMVPTPAFLDKADGAAA